MKLRTQLLLINAASIALLVAAVAASHTMMLLDVHQARLLTIITIAAGILSSVAYWGMTIPVSRSIQELIGFAEQVGDGQLEDASMHPSGPYEVRQLTRSVQDMKARLQSHLRQLELDEKTRRELIANVSHDLRTPIASIQSFVEALQDGVIDDTETSQAYLTTIHREVRRLNSLIDDLFELSKLEAGQETFEPVPCHLDQIIIEVLDSYSVRIHEKMLQVHVSVGDDIPVLHLMPEKMMRVLNNLVDNAVRHSPQGGLLRINVQAHPHAGFIEVTIRDEAERVTGEDAKRVFERFYRVDKSRNKRSGGAGLGLAIARSLVELHGGEIGVRTPPNTTQGNEFWFTLPLHKR
jgi:two-component system sensor histidine kinase SaeS